jgi:Tfp pilus assembly protein PilO
VSRKVKLLLTAAAIVVLAVLVWFFLLSPIRGKTADTEAEIETELNGILRATTQLKQAQATSEEGKRNQARLLELAKMVPMTEELPSLVLQIQDLADQAGIEFVEITPGEPTVAESGDFSLIPLEVTFSGTFFDVGDFAWRAEHMVAGPGRLLAVSGISLGVASSEEEGEEPTEGESPALDVKMTLYAFMSTVEGGTGTASAAAASSTTTTTAADQ